MRCPASHTLLLLPFAVGLAGCASPRSEPDAHEPTDAAAATADSPVDHADTGETSDTGATTGCSADDLEACRYQPEARYEVLAPITRDVSYEDDVGEVRTVEVSLFRPDGAPRPWPVIVWSHGGAAGLRSSVGVGNEWRDVFVGAGYAFVAIAHTPREETTTARGGASRMAMCEHFGVTTLPDCARVKYLHYDRPHDFIAVMDFLEAEAVGPLAGFLDLERVIYAGHSAGTGSTSIVGGATREIYGMPVMRPDPRPIAFLAASMEGVGDDGFPEDGFDAMSRPHLTLSGTGDDTPEAMASWRRLPFERMLPGDKHRLWIDDEQARHETFDHSTDACVTYVTARSGDTTVCDRHLVWLESAALAFVDAHARDRAQAHAWLASDALVTLSGGVVEWSHR
jgi:predicted dienelactone hydrolase